MKIKKDDKVIITKGKDRNKIGNVLKVFPLKNKIVVEGYNLIMRHSKPKKAGEKGQRIKIAKPLTVSNVKLICPKCKKPTRIGYLSQKGTNKVRFCKKCKAPIS